MRSLFFVVIACVAMSFASCGLGTGTGDYTDSIKIDTFVDTDYVDTVVVDSVPLAVDGDSR